MSRLTAEIIFLVHIAVVAILLFGWLVPGLWPFYFTLLVATLISDLYFGYCILSKWEFDLRKRIDPDLKYDYSFTSYYTYKLTNLHIGHTFIVRCVHVFLMSSIMLNIWAWFI